MRLLERLRQKPVVAKPATEEEAGEKVKLIIAHESEFPRKFRPAIRHALLVDTTIPDPYAFLGSVYAAVVTFFRCESLTEETDISRIGSPGSLNDEVDTAEEVEVLLRCFPDILTETILIIGATADLEEDEGDTWFRFFPNPISSLTFQENAVSFVPLFVELGIEIGGFKERERGGLTSASFNVSAALLNSNIERCLPILVQMKEKGFIEKEDTCDLMISLLSNDFLDELLFPDETVDFKEKRFRLLVEWNPTIFMDCGNYTYLLHSYELQVAQCEQVGEIHKMIIKLGMTQYPKTLGFVFHKMKHRNVIPTWWNRTYFEVSCTLCCEWMKRIVHDEILQSIGKNEMLEFIFTAATNDEMSLDGLYTLMRYDPMALFRS